MVAQDSLGIPLQIGDTVRYGMKNNSEWSNTNQCEWYEGELIKIEETKFSVGENNYDIQINFYEYSIQTIVELRKQSKGLQCVEFAHSEEDAQRELNNLKKELMTFRSNDVICVNKILPLITNEFPEYFV